MGVETVLFAFVVLWSKVRSARISGFIVCIVIVSRSQYNMNNKLPIYLSGFASSHLEGRTDGIELLRPQ